MRLIVSAIGSPTYKIAWFIATALSEHVGNTETYLKDSQCFVNTLNTLEVKNSDLLFNFLVVSLFTQVPIKEAIVLTQQAFPVDLGTAC